MRGEFDWDYHNLCNHKKKRERSFSSFSNGSCQTRHDSNWSFMLGSLIYLGRPEYISVRKFYQKNHPGKPFQSISHDETISCSRSAYLERRSTSLKILLEKPRCINIVQCSYSSSYIFLINYISILKILILIPSSIFLLKTKTNSCLALKKL